MRNGRYNGILQSMVRLQAAEEAQKGQSVRLQQAEGHGEENK